jgi:hypothetical protein
VILSLRNQTRIGQQHDELISDIEKLICWASFGRVLSDVFGLVLSDWADQETLPTFVGHRCLRGGERTKSLTSPVH